VIIQKLYDSNLHCWDIFARESIGRVANQQTCFTYSSITHKQQQLLHYTE